MWAGVPEKNLEPWRDTGIELRGPAVADVEQAFAQVWNSTGDDLPADEAAQRDMLEQAGDKTLRVVATEPASAGMLRMDLLVATLARNRLWLTDAY
jgi:cardiolipin synthase